MGTEHDPNVGNNTTTEMTKVNPTADLVVTQVDSPDPVLVENRLTYTVTVDNNGPSSAPEVVVTDTLPTDVTFVSATPNQGSCSHTSGTVTCNLGTLADGASATVTILVIPSTLGALSNTVNVTSGITYSDLATNSTAATTTSEPVPGLSLVFWGLMGIAGLLAVLIIFGFVRWYGAKRQRS